jgi:hypothetical protein
VNVPETDEFARNETLTLKFQPELKLEIEFSCQVRGKLDQAVDQQVIFTSK